MNKRVFWFIKNYKIQLKMSENLQQEKIIKDLQDALDSIDEKYHDDTGNCEKCIEKLNVYTRFVTDLCDKGVCSHYQQDLEATTAKVQHDLNTVRDCLGSRKEIEKQAIESLSEGMMKFASKFLMVGFINIKFNRLFRNSLRQSRIWSKRCLQTIAE